MRVWVNSSSVEFVLVLRIAQCLPYGEGRRVLMHAWLNSVHRDATREACEVYASA